MTEAERRRATLDSLIRNLASNARHYKDAPDRVVYLAANDDRLAIGFRPITKTRDGSAMRVFQASLNRITHSEVVDAAYEALFGERADEGRDSILA